MVKVVTHWELFGLYESITGWRLLSVVGEAGEAGSRLLEGLQSTP